MGSPRRKDHAQNASPKVAQAEASAADTGSKPTQDLEEVQVPVLRRFHLTLKSFIAVCIFLIGTTYAVVKYVEIDPLSKQLATTKEALTSSETDRTAQSTRLTKLQSQYDELTRTLTRPALIFPKNDASLLGGTFTLEWEYPQQVRGYIIELRKIGQIDEPPKLIAAARPEVKRQFFELGREVTGEFLWRVQPGLFSNNRPVSQGEWSAIHRFLVYPTVLARVKKTGVLLVGTTPTAYDEFIANDGVGGHKGFEVELITRLANELAPTLTQSKSVQVQFVELPWSQLFHAVDIGEVDLAIRSITKSSFREKQFRNLRFSAGYLKNHQIIICRNTKVDFPASLQGAVVGVKGSTINERAARYLSSRFKWKVDPAYTNYGDLYRALEEGTIEFALVDSVLGAKFTKYRFHVIGHPLDSLLQDFYETEIGYLEEEYSIAYHESEGDESLGQLLNKSLTSDKGKAILTELRKEYGIE